jgi:hypothetical protein
MPLLSDPGFDTYRTYGFGRARVGRLVLSPALWLASARLLLRGGRPRLPREDVFELGGDALVDANGRIAWIHRSTAPNDRPSSDELLRRLGELNV